MKHINAKAWIDEKGQIFVDGTKLEGVYEVDYERSPSAGGILDIKMRLFVKDFEVRGKGWLTDE